VIGMMKFSAAVKTDPGLRREGNEDSYSARQDLGLFLVADGMGGHAAGEVASRTACETIEKFISDTQEADHESTWPFPYDNELTLDGNPPSSRTSVTAGCTCGATGGFTKSHKITRGSASRCAPAC